jgi:putative FmdB family regulatory protein
MPTYEYECTGCGQHIEVFQRFSEDSLTTCRNCGGALRKVFHPAGIVFKGSGFYATDSRSKKPSTPGTKKKEGSSTKADPSSGSSSGGGSSGDGASSTTPSSTKDPS